MEEDAGGLGTRNSPRFLYFTPITNKFSFSFFRSVLLNEFLREKEKNEIGVSKRR
jgi:hypothetical protein